MPTYETDPVTSIVTIVDDNGQAIGVLSPTTPPPAEPPPTTPEQPTEETTTEPEAPSTTTGEKTPQERVKEAYGGTLPFTVPPPVSEDRAKSLAGRIPTSDYDASDLSADDYNTLNDILRRSMAGEQLSGAELEAAKVWLPGAAGFSGGLYPEDVTQPETFISSAEFIKRKTEYQQALEFANQINNGQAEIPSGIDPNEYWRSIEDIQNKLNTIQTIETVVNSYREAGVEIPTDVKKQLTDMEALVTGGVSTFYDTTQGTIDIATALSTGAITPEQLRELGVSDKDINDALEANNRKQAETRFKMKYGSDPLKAIESGDIELVRTIYGGLATVDLQVALADKRYWEATVLPEMPVEFQEAYKAGDIVKVNELLKQYQVSQEEFDRWIATEAPEDLRKAYQDGGIEAYQALVIKKESERQQAIAELQGYRLPLELTGAIMRPAGSKPLMSDNYNILKAIKDGVSEDTIRKAFGNDALKETKDLLALQERFEKSYQSPAKLLKDGTFTPDELRQLLGDEAEQYIRNYEAEKQAELDVKSVTTPKINYTGDWNYQGKVISSAERERRIKEFVPTAILKVAPQGTPVDKKAYDKALVDSFAQSKVSAAIRNAGLDLEFGKDVILAAGNESTIKKNTDTVYNAIISKTGKLDNDSKELIKLAISTANKAITYSVLGLPLIAQQINKDGLVKTGKDIGNELVKSGAIVATGKDSMTLKGDAFINLIFAAFMGRPVIGGAIRVGQAIKTIPKSIPMRSLSIEASTARVPFTNEQLTTMRSNGATEADIIKAGTDITTQLAQGNKIATVKVGDVEITVDNVQYQRLVGYSLFNSTPDISLIDRGGSVPIIRTFYTAGKVAIEPLQRSYLTGQRAVKPGIIEIKINDPELIQRIAPQQRLIQGGRTLEPEAPIPSLDELKGMGYRLEPIEGALGKGKTFDAGLGEIDIRRYNLVKVVGSPTGLKSVSGNVGNTGTVAIGDLHGTTNYRAVFEDINSSFGKRVITGNPNNPNSWHWNGAKEVLVVLGDSIDRGKSYEIWRNTFNRLADESKATGGKVERLLGNHELAYLSDDAIKGIEYTDIYRKKIKAGLLKDIASGKVKAATEANNKLYTHAGVSLGVFKELRGKTASQISEYLNRQFVDSVLKNDYSSKLFAKGRVEKGNSLSKNELEQGGIFWLRPQEALASQLDLGFPQVVGHNPGFGVRRIWGDNYIEADVARRTGGKGAYADTPYLKYDPIDINTQMIAGTQPKISAVILARLKITAMRDTLADFILGWDGRYQAIENIRNSKIAVKKLIKELDNQIKIRKELGDSIGVKYLQRQKKEILSPSGDDYLYGGIRLWRDIVMGRQNSVKILDGIRNLSKSNLVSSIAVVDNVRNRLSQLSDIDIRSIFGIDKETMARQLDTSNLNRQDTEILRKQLADRLSNVNYIVDSGIERFVAPLLDSDRLIARYSEELQNRVDDYNRIIESEEQRPIEYRREGVYDGLPRERGITDRTYDNRAREDRSRADELAYTRLSGIRGIESIRTPIDRIPTTTRVPAVYNVPPYTARPPITEIPEKPVILGASRLIAASPAGMPIPEGSIAWKQGLFWKYIPPPFNQDKPINLPKGVIPHGAKNTTGITPYETIQMIGRSRKGVPGNISIDLGIADIFVSDSGNTIRFVGKGELTDVGGSLKSTTQGMSTPAIDRTLMGQTNERITQNSISEDEMEIRQLYPELYYEQRQGAFRPSNKKSVSNRRKKTNRDRSFINTTLGGIRK